MIADCFDLDHSKLVFLVVNATLCAIYMAYQFFTFYKHINNFQGRAMIELMMSMLVVYLAVIVCLCLEHFGAVGGVDTYGRIAVESIIYLLAKAQDCIFYIFLFKLKQVEI